MPWIAISPQDFQYFLRPHIAACTISGRYFCPDQVSHKVFVRDVVEHKQKVRNQLEHRLRTPNKSFFSNISQIFWPIWADRPKKLWGTCGIFVHDFSFIFRGIPTYVLFRFWVFAVKNFRSRHASILREPEGRCRLHYLHTTGLFSSERWNTLQLYCKNQISKTMNS